MSITLYFIFALFVIAICGLFIVGKSLINLLIALELVLLSLNLLFAFSSLYLNDIVGIIFNITILTVAAAESAIGLAFILRYYFLTQTINPHSASRIKG